MISNDLDGWTAQGVAELTVHRRNNASASSNTNTIYYGHDDTGGSYGAHSGHVLQQQWVTLTASMWPAPEPPTEPTGAATGAATGGTSLLGGGGGGGGGVPGDRLPLLAAVFCGAALVVCVVFAVIIYRCCVMNRKEKPYCTRKVDIAPTSTNHNATTFAPPPTIIHHPHPTTNGHPHPNIHTYHHQYPPQQATAAMAGTSAVYAVTRKPDGVVVPSGGGTTTTTTWGYTNRIIATDARGNNTWMQQADGTMVPMQCTQCPGLCPNVGQLVVPRSSSVPSGSASPVPSSAMGSARRQRPVSQPIAVVVTNAEEQYKKPSPMPEICEFSPPTIQYASSSILDEVGTREDSPGSSSLKTRSLPAWVRSKPRPLSTEDDLNDLYAKVNFSKKRKNRMRNDEAAIIALSKSRSQFLHKDTDSLVDNEAVIVYDERTAL